MSALNDDGCENMQSMFVTLLTSHEPMSALNDVALENMQTCRHAAHVPRTDVCVERRGVGEHGSMVVTLLTSHEPMSALNDVAS